MKLILTVGLLCLLTACMLRGMNNKEKDESNEMTKQRYLDKNVFFGLTNLNNGFDAEGIMYFSENDFAIVLDRVKKLGLGINGIEPWKNGEFYDVDVFEDHTKDPTDSTWYMNSFKKFKTRGDTLQYSATYFIPENKLQDWNTAANRVDCLANKN